MSSAGLVHQQPREYARQPSPWLSWS